MEKRKDINRLSLPEMLGFIVAAIALLALAWQGAHWLASAHPLGAWLVVIAGFIVYPACCAVIGILSLLFR